MKEWTNWFYFLGFFFSPFLTWQFSYSVVRGAVFCFFRVSCVVSPWTVELATYLVHTVHDTIVSSCISPLPLPWCIVEDCVRARITDIRSFTPLQARSSIMRCCGRRGDPSSIYDFVWSARLHGRNAVVLVESGVCVCVLWRGRRGLLTRWGQDKGNFKGVKHFFLLIPIGYMAEQRRTDIDAKDIDTIVQLTTDELQA